MITVICPWYRNTNIVRHQLSAWTRFPEDLKQRTRFVLIDDGSPSRLATPEVDLNLTMARILEDIPWNQPGARNLGAHLADTDFLFFTDIDHEITADALHHALERAKEPSTVYGFERLARGVSMYPHPCSFVISKAAFNAIGGFDEDFSGHRGHDDSMFRLLAERYLRREVIDVPLLLHEEALTTGLDRDHTRNTLLLKQKKQAVMDNQYRVGNRLRFTWTIDHLVTMKRRSSEHCGPMAPLAESG